MTPAGLEPAIPGSVGRCLIHWATGPCDLISQIPKLFRELPPPFGNCHEEHNRNWTVQANVAPCPILLVSNACACKRSLLFEPATRHKERAPCRRNYRNHWLKQHDPSDIFGHRACPTGLECHVAAQAGIVEVNRDPRARPAWPS